MYELIKLFKRFSLETKLFIVFFWISYLEYITDKDFKLIIIFALLLIFLIFRNIRYIFKFEKYYLLYFIYLLILLLKGLYYENFSSYILFDIVCFSAFLISLIAFGFKSSYSKPSFFIDELPKIAYVLNISSLFFLVIFIILNGFSMASVENGRGLDDLTTKLMSPKYFLTISLFFYPLKSYVTEKKKRIVFDLAIISYIFFSLAMASRSTTIIGVIVLIATYFNTKQIKINFSLFFNKRFHIFIFLGVISALMLYQIPKIGSATDFLIYRFTEEKNLGESRTEEALEIYKALSTNELFFGKGLGAANTYWIFDDVPNGVNSAHYGWMFLILKGGILFMIFIYGKIVVNIIFFLRSKELVPYGITLSAFLFLEYSHTSFNSFFNLSFMFIALSAFTINTNKNVVN